MARAGRWFLFIVVGGLVVLGLGAATLRVSPLGPGPSLPPGATALTIETQRPQLVPTLGCRTARLSPVQIRTVGDRLDVVSIATSAPVRVVWPSGWKAWRIDGAAVLVDYAGTVIGREGDVLDDLGGRAGDDGAFHVCIGGL